MKKGVKVPEAHTSPLGEGERVPASITNLIIQSLLGSTKPPKVSININPTNASILRYLEENFGKEKTLSDISKDLNIDYKNVWRYIQKFRELEIVNLSPEEQTPGKKTYVSLNPDYNIVKFAKPLTIDLSELSDKDREEYFKRFPKHKKLFVRTIQGDNGDAIAIEEE